MTHFTRKMLGLSGVAGFALALSATTALSAGCPAITATDMKGLEGAFPLQFELAEFQKKADCTLSFSENPQIKDLNGRIVGNESLPPLAERLPEEPLVVAPYEAIGTYGGTLKGLSKATEAGTSDVLSFRHVNLFRYHHDLQTVVPNIAKAWSWNDDYTVLTIELRKGHKWSDGAPFTAEDIVFWYEDLVLNDKIYPKTPSRWLFGGKPMKVEAKDETTVVMTFPVPTPGIVNRFAVDFGQPFQPKHFLRKFHVKYNPDADKLAKERGVKDWSELLKVYYNGSDWKDVPTPLLSGADKMVTPTLESHIVVEDTATNRHAVANPYFHMVDTAGHQLPYVDEIEEEYVKDKQVQNLKITNGEVSFLQQSAFLEDFPLLKENESKGNYTVDLPPALGQNVFYSYNTTHKDPELRKIFDDVRFRQATSLAINRDEMTELVYLGQGTPMQSLPVEPATVSFVDDEDKNYMIEYDPDRANALLDEMGLKDSDGDDLRERFDGKPLVVRLVYCNQGGPVKMHELFRDYMAAIGVRVDLKEVTSDEYRASANNNDLDMAFWQNDNTAAPTVSQNVVRFVPVFGDYFSPATGFGWAAWKSSGGKEGIEPPADAKKLYELADKFIQLPIGTPQSNRIGKEIVKIHVKNLWKIGTVGDVRGPIVHSNAIGNYHTFKAKAYDYYWTYPYRPQQWFLKK